MSKHFLFSQDTWEAFRGDEKILVLMRDADTGDESALTLLRFLATANAEAVNDARTR